MILSCDWAIKIQWITSAGHCCRSRAFSNIPSFTSPLQIFWWACIFQSPCQRAFINGKMYKNWCLNTKHQKFRKIKTLFKIPVLWHQNTVHVYLAKKTSDSWIPKTPDQLMSIMHANTQHILLKNTCQSTNSSRNKYYLYACTLF